MAAQGLACLRSAELCGAPAGKHPGRGASTVSGPPPPEAMVTEQGTHCEGGGSAADLGAFGYTSAG